MFVLESSLTVPMTEGLTIDCRRAAGQPVWLDVDAALGLLCLFEAGKARRLLTSGLLEVVPSLLSIEFADQGFKLGWRQLIDVGEFLGSGFGWRRWIGHFAFSAGHLTPDAAIDHGVLFVSKVNKVGEVFERELGKWFAALALLLLLVEVAEVAIGEAQGAFIDQDEHGVGWSGGKEFDLFA